MASGGRERSGQSSKLTELTSPSPEATLPPAKPSPVWPQGLKCLSQRDNSSQDSQHSQFRERTQGVQGAEPRAGSQEGPPLGPPHHLLLRGKC